MLARRSPQAKTGPRRSTDRISPSEGDDARSIRAEDTNQRWTISRSRD